MCIICDMRKAAEAGQESDLNALFQQIGDATGKGFDKQYEEVELAKEHANVRLIDAKTIAELSAAALSLQNVTNSDAQINRILKLIDRLSLIEEVDTPVSGEAGTSDEAPRAANPGANMPAEVRELLKTLGVNADSVEVQVLTFPKQ